MKNNNLPWFLFIIAIIIILCLVTCEGQEKIVYTKEKSGVFKDTIIEHDTIVLKTPKKIIWNEKEILVYREIDTVSVKNYLLKDSIQKLNDFINSNTISEYKSIREDSLVKIEVFGRVKSKIESMNIAYLVKKQPIKQKTEKSLFKISVGLETQINQNPIFKPNLYLDIGEKNSFSYSYDNTGNHWFGYRRNIFNYKK